jgi:hypothetical protein
MRQSALAILFATILVTPAFAQAPVDIFRADRVLEGLSLAAAAPLAPRPTPAVQAPAADPAVSVLVGADMPTVYFFRGFRQEGDPKFTFQPFVDVGVAASDTVSLNVGTWNSFHSGSLKDSELGYYETDLYAALTTGMLKTTYTAYTYPNIDDSAIHELMFSTTFDDSANAFALAPSVALAVEFAKPTGLDKGIYLELGVTPGIPLADAPVAISIPVKVGLSLKDYYGDETFGYASVGVNLSVPITDMFEVHGGVTGYRFGDYLKGYNDESSAVVGSFGFGISF